MKRRHETSIETIKKLGSIMLMTAESELNIEQIR